MDALEAVSDAIRRYRFSYVDEDALQAALADALRQEGFKDVRREVRLSAGERVDLLVDGIVVEVKVNGGRAALERQLERYARSDAVAGLLVVSSRASQRVLPPEIGGKPVACVSLISAGL